MDIEKKSLVQRSFNKWKLKIDEKVKRGGIDT